MSTIFLENKMESKKQIILKSLKLQVLNILSVALKQTKAISRLLEFFQILYSEHQMKKIQQQIRVVVDLQSLIIKAIIKIDFLCLPNCLRRFAQTNNIVVE